MNDNLPTPRYTIAEDEHDITCSIFDNLEYIACAPDEKKAALIAKLLNSHAALVEALEFSIYWLTNIMEYAKFHDVSAGRITKCCPGATKDYSYLQSALAAAKQTGGE